MSDDTSIPEEELEELFEIKVVSATYMTRHMSSKGVNLIGLKHHGILITLEDGVQLFLHKGPNYGNSSDTILTRVRYLTRSYEQIEDRCAIPGRTLRDFFESALPDTNYGLLFSNCIRAAGSAWETHTIPPGLPYSSVCKIPVDPGTGLPSRSPLQKVDNVARTRSQTRKTQKVESNDSTHHTTHSSTTSAPTDSNVCRTRSQTKKRQNVESSDSTFNTTNYLMTPTSTDSSLCRTRSKRKKRRNLESYDSTPHTTKSLTTHTSTDSNLCRRKDGDSDLCRKTGLVFPEGLSSSLTRHWTTLEGPAYSTFNSTGSQYGNSVEYFPTLPNAGYVNFNSTSGQVSNLDLCRTTLSCSGDFSSNSTSYSCCLV